MTYTAGKFNRRNSCHRCMQYRDYFVSGTNTTRLERNVQCFCSTAHANPVRHPDISGKLGLERSGFFAQNVPTLIQHPEDGSINLQFVGLILS